MTTTTATPGQLAYEADCRAVPTYMPGKVRATWAQIDALCRSTWDRDPSPRYLLQGDPWTPPACAHTPPRPLPAAMLALHHPDRVLQAAR